MLRAGLSVLLRSSWISRSAQVESLDIPPVLYRSSSPPAYAFCLSRCCLVPIVRRTHCNAFFNFFPIFLFQAIVFFSFLIIIYSMDSGIAWICITAHNNYYVMRFFCVKISCFWTHYIAFFFWIFLRCFFPDILLFIRYFEPERIT